MDFFRRQDVARRRTRWLLAGFALAVAATVAAVDLAVFWALGLHSPAAALHEQTGFALATTLVVLAVILGASWRKARELRGGGAAVARALGGVPVTRANTELEKRQLLNVVEEMALAARIAPPKVFVIPGEPGINAFAAGHRLEDAAIAVTEGALTHLDRDELQAVIGHEFSHVLNGDMATNVKLVAWLHGLYAITVIGRELLNRDSGRTRRGRIGLLGFALVVVGGVGHATGRLLQAAVSRRREELADASAVQFTRNPRALRNALLKIAGHAAGSHVAAPASVEIAHMFFASGVRVRWASARARLFETHPPIADRIRALDPSFVPSSLARLAREAIARRPVHANAAGLAGGAPVATAAAQAPGDIDHRPPTAPTPSAASTRARPAAPISGRADAHRAGTVVGASGTAAVAAASASARPATPTGDGAPRTVPYPPPVHREPDRDGDRRVAALQRLQAAPASSIAATAYALAAVLTRLPRLRPAHLQSIARAFGPELAGAVDAAAATLDAAPARGRLTGLVALLPTLAGLPEPERRRLGKAVRVLHAGDPAPTVLRACFAVLIAERVVTTPTATPDLPVKAVLAELLPLLAVLARVGHEQSGPQHAAYNAGLRTLAPGPERALAPPADWPAALHGGARALARLVPGARRAARDALANAVTADGRLACEEAEILRTCCVLMDLPLPNLGDAASLAKPTRPAQPPAPSSISAA